MWFSEGRSGALVAFTDSAEHNLAMHTGDDPERVASNRAALEELLGLNEGALRFMHQVHGVAVVMTSAEHVPESAPRADAAVSVDGTALAVLTADCLPVVFVADSVDGGVPLTAVAHAGRRGLLDGVLQATVSALRERGGEHLTAWIGPAICGACYEVPEDMQADAARALPGIASRTRWGTPGLDLPGAAADLLAGLGVRVATQDVDRSAWCTLEHTELPSYRRDATASRLAGLVWVPTQERPDRTDRRTR